MNVLSTDAIQLRWRGSPFGAASSRRTLLERDLRGLDGTGRPRHDVLGHRLALLTRRRQPAPLGPTVLASADGQVRGLRLPGPAWPSTRWHPHVAVVVVPGEMWVSGNGETRCYPVAGMVQASFASRPPRTLQVDFLDGAPLHVTLADDGSVLDALRHEIWEYEKRLFLAGRGPDGRGPDDMEFDSALDVSPAQLAESEALLTSAFDGVDDGVGTGADPAARRALVRQSAELRRDARVDALRRRRRRLLGGATGGRTGGPERGG